MRILAALLLGCVLALSGAGGARAAEQIERFDSRIVIAQDGTLTVTERIRVRAEHRDIRHGLYRDFPIFFRDEAGRRHEVPFKVLSVRRDNRPEPFWTERHANFVRIYAGDKGTELRPGAYVYTFSYETARQFRWFGGGPELDWNVTGNFWRFPIAKATVRIKAPGGARPTRWTAYTGPLRARGTAFEGAIGTDGVLGVETTGRLAPGEGLTIVAEYPPGTVTEPTRQDRAWYAILDNRAWLAGGLGFALVLAYYVTAWRAVGRDPEGGLIIPRFAPPEGVSPALANYIRNWGFSEAGWRAFTAAALSLAVRGLVLFDQNGKELTLRRTAKAVPPRFDALPPGERAILNWVEREGGSGRITRENGKAVAEAAKTFRRTIHAENRDRFFRHNYLFFGIGAGLTGAAILLTSWLGGIAFADFLPLAPFLFLAVGIGFGLAPAIRRLLGAASTPVLLRSALGLTAFVTILILETAKMLGARDGGWDGFVGAVAGVLADHPEPFALFVGFALVNGLFVYLLRAPTVDGRAVMDELEGFRLYLTTAETPRLDMHPPVIDQERFEALLPYAVALDAERPWTAAFESALRRAHPGEDPVGSYRPDWRYGGGWSGRDLPRAVSASIAAATASFAAAMPSTSSSGFGGGGGSGGGGGGGGGGGW
ncbi:DUF2207 family protein [Propylenella binzhouense]|uniref:DUF2207 family protein n=1 Tax=Propylenella binzhouense TaxID=2555902 RepID=UPI001370886F